MRLSFVSDTHEQHRALTQALIAAKSDVVVHCGDFTGRGDLPKVKAFADWCGMLVRKRYTRAVVVIAGNHDLTFEHPDHAERCADMLRAQTGLHYLKDSSLTFEGIVFYGSPWTPRFFDWAFQMDTAEQAAAIWSRVPPGVDVLVTHGPPRDIRDECPDGRRVGCPTLAHVVRTVRPKIHAFGHIHGQYGQTLIDGTLYVNACTCTEAYRPTNAPITIDIAAGER